MAASLSFAACLLAGALAIPAAAAAERYCVNEPACVSAGGEDVGSEGTALQTALTAAETHAGSSVAIGAGAYSLAKGFHHAGDAVTIQGAGAGSTTLTTPAEKGISVLTLNGAGSTLTGVGIEIPAGEGDVGLSLDGGSVEGVSISGGGGTDIPTGLDISSGSFSHGSVEMDETTTSSGVDPTGGEVSYSTISGSYGVEASIAATFRACRISGRVTVISSYYTDLTVEDSLLDLRGGSYGIWLAANTNGAPAEGTFRQLTIVNGGAGSQGLRVEANKVDASAELEDSIISGVEVPISQSTVEPSNKTTVKVDYSSFDAADDLGSPGEEVEDENPVSTTPDFVEAMFGETSEGDWRLRPGSPLIGAGTPGPLAAGEFAFDLAGNPRVVDGVRDVGAYEYQRAAPVVSAQAAPSTVRVGASVSFSGSALDSELDDAIVGYQWTFDDGASVAGGATATHAFSTPGTHTATLTATDLVGVTGAAVVQVTVDPLPGILCACGLLKGPGQITALRLTPSSFRAARNGGSIARARTGSRVSYKLSSPGRVTFTVEHVTGGIAHGRSCVASRKGLHGKRCTRDVRMRGSFARASHEGANAFRFTGRLGGHALAPGNYLLLATYRGRDKAGAQARFRITG